jgi:prepilin-type N-terminal cleavage/methylation domain-containing protein
VEKMRTNGFRAFTLPELLTVIAVIAILIGVLMPALSQVKRIAKETKQKAQIGSIDIGINLYKNDFGEYPPSHGDPNGSTINPALGGYDYCGAQTLAEALLGYDLLGVHPDSVFRADGKDNSGNNIYLDPNLSKRKGPYLARENIGVFEANDIYDPSVLGTAIEPSRYIICDVFTAVSRDINGKKYKIGTPILYFRANPSAEYTELTPCPPGNADELAKNIYNWRDNIRLLDLGKITDKNIGHPLLTDSIEGDKFYGFIGDPMILKLRRPVRPDTFILISAGNDGLYGTRDDICNFEPNLPG